MFNRSIAFSQIAWQYCILMKPLLIRKEDSSEKNDLFLHYDKYLIA